MIEPPLSTTNASLHFEDEAAVDGVSLDVQYGEIHAIVGLNGAGKTTLMRMLLGMIRPDAGEVRVAGVPVEEIRPSGWSAVGYLIETPFAYPELTVEENLWMAARLRGFASTEIGDLVERSILRFGLRQWSKKRSRALSLGNRQRLGLASATMHDPTILVLDEPVNALDPAGVVMVRELLREEAALGRAILVSSHHLDEIARVAHRITVMHRGRIVGSLDPDKSDLERQFFETAYAADQQREMMTP